MVNNVLFLIAFFGSIISAILCGRNAWFWINSLIQKYDYYYKRLFLWYFAESLLAMTICGICVKFSAYAIITLRLAEV